MGFASAEISFGLAEMGFALSEISFGLAEMGFGLAEISFGLAEMNFAPTKTNFYPKNNHLLLQKYEFITDKDKFCIWNTGSSPAT